MFTEKTPETTAVELDAASSQSTLSRRKFFGISTALVAAAAIASCKNKDEPMNNNGIDLGSGDVGVLNYAYALEQLEAAFYVKVAQSFYSGITPTERAYLSDIRDHEVAHREFFKAAITAAGATPLQDLVVNFSSINFADRTSVLSTAQAFEDLGVNAYNGAGKLITNPAYLVIAGKIVSVEARHAATIRDLISYGTFANSVDMNGMDSAKTPAQVLAIAGTYITTPLNASNLPTS